jgi:hypothetical protein
MFGQKKRIAVRMLQLLEDMEKSSDKARLVIFMAYSEASGVLDRGEAAQLGIKAIYGEPLGDSDDVHPYDVEKTKRDAMQWLVSAPLYRELAVETLRVIQVIRKMQGDERELPEGSALDRFGEQYPAPMTPEKYRALLRYATLALPEAARVALESHK